MPFSHNLALAERPALSVLHEFLQGRRRAKPVDDLEKFEAELHAVVTAVEREAMAEELARLDVNVPAIAVDGVVHRQVLRCEETYCGAAGPIRVMRSLYSTRQDGERTICPMELKAGILEGRWTPLAANQATWVVAHLTPQEGEGLFKKLGNMTPSKSSLDRLPKQLSQRWEADRVRLEQALRAQETVPERAVTVAVSLDGALAPMKDGQRQEKRAEAAVEGKQTRGPAGYQEVGCGTVSFYDREGELLATKRMARMPETKKATLKAMLRDELRVVLEQRPDLKVVKVADGARDNWTYLSGEILAGVEVTQQTDVMDFYHAGEQLHGALERAYGEGSFQCAAQFEKLRHVLRHDDHGVEKVIRSLRYQRDCHPRSKKIAQVVKFFRRNRRRMNYAKLAAEGLPIGSGIVEAACKTLVTQRLKRSGMRWRHEGGQAILTFRGLAQSDRFERGWQLLAATYKSRVTLPANVVAFDAGRAR